MSAPDPHDLFSWTQFLSSRPLPALPATLSALADLRARQDSVSPSDIAQATLADPLLALIVLRRLQERKASSRRSDITTIEHAVMMLGVEPFFASFCAVEPLDRIVSDPEALAGVERVARRSYVASQLALDWARRLRDMQSEEVQVAALIHDMAELLLWIHAPHKAKLIASALKADPALHSARAQEAALGFPLSDAEAEICRLWGLPELSRSLLKEQGAASVRARLVRLAARLARHAQDGLANPALPDDWAECADLLDFDDARSAQEALAPRLVSRAAEWDARIAAHRETQERLAGEPPGSDRALD